MQNFDVKINSQPVVRRVRAILLTDDLHILFIKRVKPNKPQPYWVAPGGGVEADDENLLDSLERELIEELGATATVLDYPGFVLRHQKANKNLEEHFFICRLIDFDLSLRNGPEFEDPARGAYIPDMIPLTTEAISGLALKTPALRDWLLDHLDDLRSL